MMNTTMMILFELTPFTDLRWSAPDTEACIHGGKSWEECFSFSTRVGTNFFCVEIIAKIIMQGQKLWGGERWDFFAKFPTRTNVGESRLINSCTSTVPMGARVSDLRVLCTERERERERGQTCEPHGEW